MRETITFDKNASAVVLKIFEKEVDSEGYIVEKNDPTQKVIKTQMSLKGP